ncbi:MAG: NUDIX domain-containing protein [Gammaproteobacteria bacterium]|nr:NUDIX domain-containing protein [Gammaproteobacteria bacterium]
MNCPGAADPALEEHIIALDPARAGEMYPIGKLAAHEQNIRHKAISIFVFHDNRLLLQKRADNKYHSGGLWTNTVCSHPRWQETSDACAARRMQEELGWSVPLRHFGRIDYKARVGSLYENEQVQCYVGETIELPALTALNPAEVAEVQWLDIPTILERIEQRPADFTEWFKIYLAEHHSLITDLLSGSARPPGAQG